jgi:hypothetical protein
MGGEHARAPASTIHGPTTKWMVGRSKTSDKRPGARIGPHAGAAADPLARLASEQVASTQRPAAGGSCGCGHAPPAHAGTDHALVNPLGLSLARTRLAVSSPEDPAEREADRVAARVVSGATDAWPAIHASSGNPPGPAVASAPGLGGRAVAQCETVQRTCASCAEEELLQRQALPGTQPTMAPAAAEAGPAAVIVDDVAHVGPGQITRSAFMALVRAQVAATCDEELARVRRTAADCPYLRHWLDYYDRCSARQIERAVAKYTGVRARDSQALLDAVVGRARAAVWIWAATGRVTGIPSVTPAETEAQEPGVAGPGAAVQAKMRASSATPVASAPSTPGAVRASLGVGRSLDAGVRARMERGFGRSFEAVRVHTDANAAGLATGFRARVFTVGSDIAFGAGEFRPGTLPGDLLIAHEPAHTVQQGGSTTAATGGDHDLEYAADRTAIAVVVGMPSPQLAPVPSSGLRLQRCVAAAAPAAPAALGGLWAALETIAGAAGTAGLLTMKSDSAEHEDEQKNPCMPLLVRCLEDKRQPPWAQGRSRAGSSHGRRPGQRSTRPLCDTHRRPRCGVDPARLSGRRPPQRLVGGLPGPRQAQSRRVDLVSPRHHGGSGSRTVAL